MRDRFSIFCFVVFGWRFEVLGKGVCEKRREGNGVDSFELISLINGIAVEC